tara:strand:- start:5040 stop:5318 length:279 start_codon:yes stop_codon:yes gene_type:complete
MITVYSKNLCGYCDMAKAYLNKNGLEFEEINIESVPEAREFLITEGHITMPQIYHNGKLLVEGGAMGLVKLQPETVRELIGEVKLDVKDFKL